MILVLVVVFRLGFFLFSSLDDFYYVVLLIFSRLIVLYASLSNSTTVYNKNDSYDYYDILCILCSLW
jgi:hypothetical protein